MRRRQVSWLAAQRPPRPSRSVLQWSIEEGSPPTVAGAAAVLCKHAPRSLSRRQCDYRGWAHERNAAGAVTAHDAIAPHSKNNSAKAEAIEFPRNLVGKAPLVGVRRMRASARRRHLKPRRAISQCKPLRDARLALSSKWRVQDSASKK